MSSLSSYNSHSGYSFPINTYKGFDIYLSPTGYYEARGYIGGVKKQVADYHLESLYRNIDYAIQRYENEVMMMKSYTSTTGVVGGAFPRTTVGIDPWFQDKKPQETTVNKKLLLLNK